MFTDSDLTAGIRRNNDKAYHSGLNQLKLIYERFTPTNGQLRQIIKFPKSAIHYDLQFVLLGIPKNSILNNLWLVIYSDSGNVKYIQQNLRDGNLGAKVNLFSSPAGDVDPALTGDENQYVGMIPLNIRFKGDEEIVFEYRGESLSSLAYIDVLLYGHLKSRDEGGSNERV